MAPGSEPFDGLKPTDYVTEVLFVLAVVLVAAAGWLWRQRCRGGARYSYPPGPYSLPLIGNLLGLKDGERYLARLAPVYGDVCTIHMGSIPVVVVNSNEAAKELMTDPNLFNERAPAPALEDYFKGRGLGGAHYPDGFFAPQRELITKILRRLNGVGYHAFEAKLQEEVDYLKDIVREHADGRPFDMLSTLQFSVLNFMWVLILGERFAHDDPFNQRMVSTLHGATSSMKYVTASLLFPAFLRIPGNGVKKMFSYLDQAYALLAEKITSYRQREGHPTSEDLVGLFMREMEKYSEDPSKAPGFLNEDNLRFVVQDLAMAGLGTTSTTLYWLILYLIRNPAMQQRAFDDINRVAGNKERVTLADSGSLPYIHALIFETLRASALVPMIARSNIRDFEYKGHLIPRGTFFIFNYYNSTIGESLWDDSAAFRPERFLGQDGNPVTHSGKFKPFGLGRRVCIGEVFVKKELFLIISNLLKDFEFSVLDGVDPPTTDAITDIMRNPHPYEVRIRDRRRPVTSTESRDAKSPILDIPSSLTIDCGNWSNEVRSWM